MPIPDTRPFIFLPNNGAGLATKPGHGAGYAIFAASLRSARQHVALRGISELSYRNLVYAGRDDSNSHTLIGVPRNLVTNVQ
jgi:hypothetical protein